MITSKAKAQGLGLGIQVKSCIAFEWLTEC